MTAVWPRSRLKVGAVLDEALAGIAQRPGRTVLTMLGTILGLGSFVALAGITSTASQQISTDFTLAQASQVSVVQNPPPSSPSQPFPPDSSQRLSAIDGVVAGGVIWPVRPTTTVTASKPFDGAPQRNFQVFAMSPGALRAADASLAYGQFYGPFADSVGARQVLLAPAAATQLGLVAEALPADIWLDGQTYTVVGVLADVPRYPQALAGAIVPTGTALKEFGLPSIDAPARVLVQTRVGAAQVVADQVCLALRPDAPRSLAALAPPSADSMKQTVAGRLNFLFVALAAISLVIGALGIANTTLVSVMERVPEIGLRRAMGARRHHIWAQFVTETALIGGMGGVVGTTVGLVAILAVSRLQQWTPVVEPATVYLGPPAGLVIGVLAGFYPALKASRVEPVVALST